MVVTYLGQFDQHRAKTAKKYEIHFFVACILGGKGVPTTQSKGEQECILAWETKETIENMLEGQLENIPEKEYAAQFNCRTHLAAFQKFLQMEAK